MGERVRLGQTYRLDVPVNDGGTPAAPIDPATLTATFRRSDGTVAAVKELTDFTRLSEGEFRLFVTTGAGQTLTAVDTYAVEVTTTVPAGGAVDWLDVVPFVPELVTLLDVKEQLNKTRSTRVDNDAELQRHVDAVNGWLRRKCGPVLPETVTELVTQDPRTGDVRLSARPVLAVLSATYAGSPVDIAGWAAPSEYGRITLPVGVYPTAPVGYPGLAVTVRAGRVPVPAEIPLAGRQLVQHLWRLQRELSAAPPSAGDDVITVAGVGYAVPNRVMELLDGFLLDELPGFA